SAKQHVSRTNAQFKGIGSTINISQHFDASAKKVEREAQAHVGRLNGIFSRAGEGIKSGVGSIFSGALSVFGGNVLFSGVEKAADLAKEFLEIGIKHQQEWEMARLRITAFPGSARAAEQTVQGKRQRAIDP